MAYFIEFIFQGLSVLCANHGQAEKISEFVSGMVLYGIVAWCVMEFHFLGIVFRNIYLYRNQNRKKAAEDIYFRTDHHWTPLGAYYAAQKFAEVANLDFKDLSDYQKNDIEGFVGTMYAFTEDPHINNDSETFTYYVPSNMDKCTTAHYDTDFTNMKEWDFFVDVGDPQHNAYLTFMGGDEQVVRVKNECEERQKACHCQGQLRKCHTRIFI